MFLETVRADGLAQLSYVLGDGQSAVVIDPQRDCDRYVEIARRHGARVTHVLETHRNEDFAIGSVELAEQTGATILHGGNLPFEYGRVANDGDEIQVGKLTVHVLETPGHTFESLSFAVYDTEFSEEHPFAVFTGDCLFVGDVGRTDLVPEGREEEAAGALYDSIFEKLLPLGDGVLVHPAHGAGSVCGAGMADRDSSSIGYERRTNGALQVDSREEFVKRKLAEEHYRPPYFRRMEQYNLSGPPILGKLPRPEPVGADELAERMEQGLQVVDVRQPAAWLGSSVPGSLSLPVQTIASYGGYVLDYDHPIGIVADGWGDVSAAVVELVRLGYDRVTCFLAGGITAWETSGRAVEHVHGIDVHEVEDRSGRDEIQWLDVRKGEELAGAEIPGAKHIFLGHLPRRMEELDRDRRVVVFCGSGQRATIAASLLRRQGLDPRVWLGSIGAAKAAGSDVVET